MQQEDCHTSALLKQQLLLSTDRKGCCNDEDPEQACKLTIEECFQFHVGDFGVAQLIHFLLVTLAWTLVGQQTFTMMFTERVPGWHCVDSHGSTVPCSPPASTQCSMDRSQWQWDTPHSFSVVTEWDLVCGDAYKASLVGSTLFTGFLIGAGLAGSLSDGVLGRKWALGVSLLFAAVCGLMAAGSNQFWIYLLLRGLTGIGLSGVSVTQYILATELFGPSTRGQAGLATAYTYSLGQMVLPLTAYLFPSWRALFVATTVPMLLYCCCILPLLEESPHWYLVHGQEEKAREVMKRFARRNGTSLPDNVRLVTDAQVLQDEENVADLSVQVPEGGEQAGSSRLSERGRHGKQAETTPWPEQEEGRQSIYQVFENSVTRNRLLVMLYSWFTCAVVYYGISLNSVNLGSNVYVSTFMSGFIEWPAYIMLAFVVDRVGRKTLICSGFLLSGLCCLLATLYVNPSQGSPTGSTIPGSGPPPERSITMQEVLRVVCSLMGKFGIASAYALNYVYTGELFPTVVRNTALSIASQASQLGSIAAPWVLVLGSIHSSIPFTLMGLLGSLAGVVTLLLPETLNQPLADTMEALS